MDCYWILASQGSNFALDVSCAQDISNINFTAPKDGIVYVDTWFGDHDGDYYQINGVKMAVSNHSSSTIIGKGQQIRIGSGAIYVPLKN